MGSNTYRTNLWPIDTKFGIISRFSVRAQGTIDLGQDAETFRSNVGWNINPAINGSALCNADFMLVGPLGMHCSIDAQLEIAHVFDAGTSANLADDEDDQFVLAGGQVATEIFLRRTRRFNPGPLRDITLAVSYRHLASVAGAIQDQNRFSIALRYQVPGLRTIQFSLSYEDGENLQTFQDEELLRLSIGFRL